MKLILLILYIKIICLLVLYYIYLPSLDFTREGKYVLWYGRKTRNFIILNKNDKRNI